MAVLIKPDDVNSPTVFEIVGLVVGEFNEGRGVVASHMDEVLHELQIVLE